MPDLSTEYEGRATELFDAALQQLDSVDFRMSGDASVAGASAAIETALLEGDRAARLFEAELWRNLALKDGTLLLTDTPEPQIDNTWLRKELIIENLGKTGLDSAFASLAPLLLATQADEIFNNRVILAVERAVVNIKGEKTREALGALENYDLAAMHPQTSAELDAAIAAYMYGTAPKQTLSAQPAGSCRFCGEALDSDAEYCPNCGMPVIKPEQEREMLFTPRESRELNLKIDRRLYMGLYLWTLANFVIGVFFFSIVSVWQIWKIVGAATKEEAMKHAKLVIAINIVSNVLGAIILTYFFGRA